MPRPSKYDWDEIKRHYEAGMSNPDIIRKFKCDKGSLSKRINKEGWVVNQLANSMIKGKVEVLQLESQLVDIDVDLARVSNEIADDRAEHLIFFRNSALRNQNLANKAIGAIENAIEEAKTPKEKDELAFNSLGVMRDHTFITKSNKEIVLGKDIETQVNIQNNNNQQNNTLTIDDLYD